MLLILPSDLDLEGLVARFPPSKPLRIPGLKFIVHIVLRRTSTLKNASSEFVTISSKILEGIIPGYKKYLDYLEERRIIIRNHSYRSGFRSKTIKFIWPISSVTFENIKDDWLKIRMSKGYQNRAETESPAFLTSWFNVNLSLKLPKFYLSNSKNRIRDAIATEEIKLHQFDWRRSPKTRRFFSTLTRMPSSMRGFLHYGDQRLVSMDISNCQAFLIASLLLDREFYSAPDPLVRLKTPDISTFKTCYASYFGIANSGTVAYKPYTWSHTYGNKLNIYSLYCIYLATKAKATRKEQCETQDTIYVRGFYESLRKVRANVGRYFLKEDAKLFAELVHNGSIREYLARALGSEGCI